MPIYKMDGKKDGKQQYRVRINYTDNTGRARQIDRVAYGSTEAKLLEKQLLEDIKKTPASSKLTIQALYEEYMAAIKPDLRETTFDKKRRILEGNILPTMGAVRLDRLTLPVLQKWKSGIAEKGLSTVTSQNYFKEFSALLNYAVKMNYLPTNLLGRIGNFKNPAVEDKTEKIRYYTAEQYVRFAAEARRNAEEKNTMTEWGYYVFFSLAFYTGMRKGEINALRWNDLDGDLLHVRHSISQKVKGEDRETGPKNRSSLRDLQMPEPLIRILDEHRDRLIEADAYREDLYICGGEYALRDIMIDKRNRAFGKAAGLPHIKIHDFRHTHASLLANEGINIQEIARRLGHSKVEITWNTYSHLYPREEERAMQILNKIV